MSPGLPKVPLLNIEKKQIRGYCYAYALEKMPPTPEKYKITGRDIPSSLPPSMAIRPGIML